MAAKREETNLEIIRRVEKGEQKSSVAAAYNIPRSTLSTLLKTKGDIKGESGTKPALRCTPCSETSLPRRRKIAPQVVPGRQSQKHSGKAKDFAFIHQPKASPQAVDGCNGLKLATRSSARRFLAESEDANDDR
ncbi:hypothetical protein HPB48_009973 [Haemaphysalis longicornis]|uniref:HTH psq-type domain-containing protein n=1 Tax=Haemaphysalis longicornis TaxID=44386 RepID=A0A9J6FWG2_HAELO|nr:hypothetical protein HPB48_009973 [Haemaphysalis longicornis]